MSVRRIKKELWVPYPAEQLFHFFSDAKNLDALTPPWLHFRILKTETPIKEGSLIEYRLRWHGLPVRWLTAIRDWNPPYGFVDVQLKGPYKLWIHSHRFEERNGGTAIIDEVEYQVPGWFLEPLVHDAFVGPDINRIFNFRMKRLAELFP